MLGLLANPTVASTSPHQQPSESGGSSGDGAADALVATESEVTETLGELTDDVSGQVAAVENARLVLEEAQQEAAEAAARVAETEERIADLTSRSDDVVVEAFINPPAEASIDILAAGSPSEAVIKQSILNDRANESAAVLSDLAEAREELVERQSEEAEATAAAETVAVEAEAVLAELEAVQSRHAVFVTQVNDRIDRGLTEAEMIADLDPDAAEELRERTDELAEIIDELREEAALREALEALQKAQKQAEAEARAEAERLAQQAAQAGPVGAATGSRSSVGCPAGGSITVDSSLASNLEALLAAAASSGFNLCGNGFRSPEEQVQVRMNNCGTSDYAIYEMPSSQCSPPTARPGASMHEQGLAIDFTCNGSLITSRSSSCFQWLAANAGSFGLINLPSEPWHWSTNGN